MKTFYHRLLLLLFIILPILFACNKTEEPELWCTTFEGYIAIDSLITPIDSIIISVTNPGGDHPETRTYVYRDVDFTFSFSNKSCGLFDYRIEVYSSPLIWPVQITLLANGNVFRKESVTGTGSFSGTYVYDVP